MSKYVKVNLGRANIYGTIPCSCITIDKNGDVNIMVEEGLPIESSCETVCVHDNNFVIAREYVQGPFEELNNNLSTSRIWLM